VRVPEVSTGRYFCTELLTSGEVVPVRGSIHPPIVDLPYHLETAPSILPEPGPLTLSEWHPTRSTYWRQLDRTGVEKVAAELTEISERHGGKPLTVLDYEDLERGHRSPRVVFARWLSEKAGIEVPEITADGRRLAHRDLHKQVRGRPRVPDEPPESLGLSWPLTEEDAESFVASVPWKAARDKRNPHEYCLRRDAAGLDFELFVLHVRERGYQRVFWGHEYTQLRIGDHEYWTMGDHLASTVVVNRKVIGQNEGEQTEATEERTTANLFGTEART